MSCSISPVPQPVSCLPSPGAAAPCGVDPATLAAGLRATLQPFVERQTIAGAVALVATRDLVLACEGIGFADRDARIPMRPDTVFWVASMTKPITAAAALMLVDAGALVLDAPVSLYWPEYDKLHLLEDNGTRRRPHRCATLRELLSHMAGLNFLPTREPPLLDAVPLAVAAERSLSEPLLTEPGVAYRYSNIGIDIVGHLIERVSGQPFAEFLQTRLFGPLGLRDTTFFPTNAQVARLARAYRVTGAGLDAHAIPFLTHPLAGNGRHPAPGGGLFSTAPDMARFGQMLVAGGTLDGHTYLSGDAVRAMTRKQTPPHIETEYGLGLSASADGRSFGHGGAYKTRMAINDGVIRLFLAQRADDWTDDNPDRANADLVRSTFGVHSLSSEPSAGGNLPPHASPSRNQSTERTASMPPPVAST